MGEKIHILDEIEVAHGSAAALRDAYLDRYVPSASARGMTLAGAWRSPPASLPDRPVTLHFLWSVPDVAGWWGMRLGAARADAGQDVPIEGDEEKLAWWRYVDHLAISRRRSFLVDAGEPGSDV